MAKVAKDAVSVVPARRDWRPLYSALLRVQAGKDEPLGFDALLAELIGLGFVENREITKPCKTCGTPRFDYRYQRITCAGRFFMDAAAKAEEQRS